MKKKNLLALGLAVVMGLSLTACGSSDKKEENKTKNDNLVYAVETGSAGEEAAIENGFEYNSVQSQADALMEVDAGTSDGAIVDFLMAIAMVGEGTSYEDLEYTDKLTTEKYGVGCRKGSDLASYINYVFGKSYSDGEMKKVAEKYKLQDALLEQKEVEYKASETDSDVEYIKNKGKLVVGITEFEPMDYQDDNGDWIGFDADMAKLVAKELGVDIEFMVIDWDAKIMELDSKNIDVVWNGMTLTSEVKNSMECTNEYCMNAQVIVVPKK